MGEMLVLFALIAAAESALYLLPTPRTRQVDAILVAGSLVVAGVWMLLVWDGLTAYLFTGLSAYRVINMMRMAWSHMDEHRLRRVGFRASAWLIGLQIIVLVSWRLVGWLGLDNNLFLGLLVWFQLLAASTLLGATLRHWRTTRAPRVSADDITDDKLPTLTVAIPARNETDDLDACLQKLIGSSYPKLEILVLDDCSQNKYTPEIIRSYAHDGVRFLQGEPPKHGWLAKNQAYQQLYQAASGELILFCGVDVRFDADSLRLLVTALVRKKKNMISVIPRNLVPKVWSIKRSALVQTMRYAWELALPRRQFGRPPVLSTCWLIRRDVILQAGSFAAVSHSVTPESHFARVSLIHDGYSFMRSSPAMSIVSYKSLDEQHSTAVRVEYPKLHLRLELVALLGAGQLVVLVLPYVLLAAALGGMFPSAFRWPLLVTILILTAMYALVVAITYRRFLARSLVALPLAALVEVVLLHESMIRYEFFTVVWKDRNVCLPVMHARDRWQATARKLPAV